MTGRFIGLFLVIMVSTSILAGMASAQETDTVHIGQGEHYDMGPYYIWGSSDLWVNMTVTRGSNVDVYIMSGNQYYNAYYPETDGHGGIAFKNHSQENVSQANIYLHIEMDSEPDMWAEDEIWVIIDNRNVNATPDDASPTGNVRVELEVDWTDNGPEFDDEFLWPIIIMIGMSSIPIILVIVILVLIFMRLGKKKEVQAPMQYYNPYPPPVPPSMPMHEPAPPEPPATGQEPTNPVTKEPPETGE